MKNFQINKKAFSLIELSIVLIIIGLLVAGVTSGRSLMKSARLKGARMLTLGSPVPQIEDLVLWLEPTLEGSFVDSDGVNVAYDSEIYEWKNKTGWGGYVPSFTQTNAGYQPTLIEEGINKLPTLRFGGVNDYFYKVGKLLEQRENCSIFIVFKPENLTVREILFGQSGGNVYAKNHYITTSVSRVGYDNYYPSGGGVISTLPLVLNSNYMFTVTYDSGSNGNTMGRTNGTGSTTNSSELYSGSTVTITSLGSFVIGSTPSSAFKGDISEIIVYNKVLTDIEIGRIENYLMQKYKIR